jgi:hypothetical protein
MTEKCQEQDERDEGQWGYIEPGTGITHWINFFQITDHSDAHDAPERANQLDYRHAVTFAVGVLS